MHVGVNLVVTFVGLWLLSSTLEWLIFKRIMDDSLLVKLSSAAAAYVLGTLFVGVRMAGESDQGLASMLLLYVPSALVLGFVGYGKGLKLRDAQR